MVVLTDGRDEDNPGTGPGSTRTWDQVVGLLREIDVTAFAVGLGTKIDPERLTNTSPRDRVESRLQSFVRLKGYRSACVVDLAGNVVAAAGSTAAAGLAGPVLARISGMGRGLLDLFHTGSGPMVVSAATSGRDGVPTHGFQTAPDHVGETGTPERLGENDYRGVPVLSANRRIAGTPWTLVVKIDRGEAEDALG